MKINDPIAQQNCLGRTAASISIVILVLGFALLGCLSLINRHQVCAGSAISFENSLSIIGGTASFLLGGLFLAAGSVPWSRPLSQA
jgi:hypothetical protein